MLIWLTGLPGSGKSTLAHAMKKQLLREGHRVVILDGDDLRRDMCSDLGFSRADRAVNVKRAGGLARELVDKGLVVFASLISPYRVDRHELRWRFAAEEFIEVYCRCPLEECERRDPKGLYQKARRGEVENFTGISAPYEEPLDADVVLDTASLSIEQCISRLMAVLPARLTAKERIK